MKHILLLMLFCNVMFGQFLTRPEHKKLPEKYLFMTTPTIPVELPKEDKLLQIKPIAYKPVPNIINLLPYREQGILHRIKITCMIGFNMKSDLDLLEKDVTSLVKYNYRLKYRCTKRWAIIMNVQTIGVNGFTNGNNYSAGFYVKI